MKDMGPRRGEEPPIDRGWAWMVLLAVTTWNFIIGGTMKSYGLLYVEFIELFQSSPVETGLIGLAFGIIAMLISPVSGRLSDTYCARKMSIVGGIVACAGVIATGYSPNIWAAVASWGLLFGGAVGIVDGPILATLGKYFEKRRVLANGIAFCGSSVGSLVLAPLTSFLIDEYSVRGALLLIAGLWLNICVVGALLRPLNTYQVSNPSDKDDVIENDDNKTDVQVPSPNCDIEVRVITCDTDDVNEEEENVDANKEEENDDANKEEENDDANKEEENDDANKKEENDDVNEDESETRNAQQMMKMVQSKSEHTYLSTTLQPKNLKRVKSKEEGMNGIHVSNPIIAALKAESKSFLKSPLTSSLPNGLHVPDAKKGGNANVDNKARSMFGSNLSITNLLYRGDSIYDLNAAVRQTTKLEKDVAEEDASVQKNTYLHFLCNPLLLRDLFVLGCGCYAYYTPIVAFPAYGDELGIDKFEIAWTVGLIGMIEVPSRICLSWMTDRFKLRPASVLTVSFFVTGVCGQSFVFAPSHKTMIAYACVHGVLGGLSMILMCSVLAECVGVEQLGSAMGLAVMQLNLAVSLGSTTAGAMKQLTGSYGSVFRVSSAVYLVGALVYCLTPRGFFISPYKSCRSTGKEEKKPAPV